MDQLIFNLKKCESVAVFGHQSPDGDCLGSISAISFLLKKLGVKQVDLFIDDDIPQRYKFLDFSFVNEKEFNSKNYDTLVTVDVAAERLLGKYGVIFKNFDNTIVIDHHGNRDLTGLYTYIDSSKASCCELVYDIFKFTGITPNSDIATYLYLGTVDDTNCFLHDNTTRDSHLAAADLFYYGADAKAVNYNVVKLQTLKTFEINKILDNNIVFDENVYYLVLTEKFMKDNNFTKEEMGDYINKISCLEGCKIAFTIIEKQHNVYSLGLRAVYGYDVSKIAQEFDGGGHKQASGGQIRGNLDENLQKLILLCKEEIRRVK